MVFADNHTETAQLVLSLLDLTSLNQDDTDATISSLAEQGVTEYGQVAALCIYPQFIALAKGQSTPQTQAFNIATVTNFPEGGDDIQHAVSQTQEAIAQGADEIDLVMPYRALMKGDANTAYECVEKCKSVCPEGVLLKVILETGELKTPELIEQASRIAIDAGADFIKTSTGKVAVNATLQAAQVMLNAIKASGKPVGFKAAGGIRTMADAVDYLQLTHDILGPDWLCPSRLRFGASALLGDVLRVLSGSKRQEQATGY